MSKGKRFDMDEVYAFEAAVPGPKETMIIAYHSEEEEDAGHDCRIAAVNRTGGIVWLQDGIEFDEYKGVELGVSPNGSYLVIRAALTTDESISEFIRVIDTSCGEPIATLEGPSSYSDYGVHKALADSDGTVLCVYQPLNTHHRVVARYSLKDEPLPLWGSKQESGSGKAEALSLPDDAYVALGGDGVFYILDNNGCTLVGYARTGELVISRELEPLPIDQLEDFTVDEGGVLHILFQHRKPIGKNRYTHLARVTPDGQPEIWLGPNVQPGSGPNLNANSSVFALPGGSLFLAGELPGIRVLDPNGGTLWLGPGTAEKDDEYLEKLEDDRKYSKKHTPDRRG